MDIQVSTLKKGSVKPSVVTLVSVDNTVVAALNASHWTCKMYVSLSVDGAIAMLESAGYSVVNQESMTQYLGE